LENTHLEKFYEELAELLGRDAVSNDPQLLNSYAQDDSFTEPLSPGLVAWPKSTADVQKIIKAALKFGVPLVPVSSGPGSRQHGDTIPNRTESAVVDLSRMNKILRIDRINRVVMVEPGVTFSQLLTEMEKHDLRLLQPLCPRWNKSVLTSALEREPTLIPRYHWDTSDPLLCTEVVFGTGDVFRTGSAAGPGTVEEQLASGAAQKNPMGPTQFNLFQTIQGAQGSLGIVTWATVKCELKPTLQKIWYAQADSLGSLLDFAHELLKLRIGDEFFLMSKVAFASLAKERPEEVRRLMPAVKEWVFVVVLTGRGEFAAEKVGYLEADMADIATKCAVSLESAIEGVDNSQLIASFSSTCAKPWRYRYKGACQEIFFVTTLDRAPAFVDYAKAAISEKCGGKPEFGVYIQPLVQGCNCHLEFGLYYDPQSAEEVTAARRAFSLLSQELLDKGAFFSRPYGEWAVGMFDRVSPEGVQTLQKVKRIFDPNSILKPGVLCFREGSQ
jgi:hypothetical protein